jgi:hypothetical protein
MQAERLQGRNKYTMGPNKRSAESEKRKISVGQIRMNRFKRCENELFI